MNAKQLLPEAVERLPEDATVEDAMDRLYFLSKVARGLQAAIAATWCRTRKLAVSSWVMETTTRLKTARDRLVWTNCERATDPIPHPPAASPGLHVS